MSGGSVAGAGVERGGPPRGRDGTHLKGGEVELAQRALVDQCVDAHAIELLVVGGEVLEGGPDTLRLDALDKGRAQLSRQPRILGKIFEVAPTQRVTLHVDAGPEQDRDPIGTCLSAERLADAAKERTVPRRAERGCSWEACRRHRPIEAQM